MSGAAGLRSEPPWRWLWLVLLCAIAFPTLATWLYFIQFAGSRWVQIVYSLGKVAQFALPVVFAMLVEKRVGRGAWLGASGAKPSTQRKSLLVGGAIGAAVVLGMWGLYFGWLAGSPVFASVPEEVRSKLADAGAATPARYAALAVFYTLAHSLLEEYYWRWFVFGRLRELMTFAPAMAISSLGFMAHHTLVVGKYFGGLSAMTLLLSAGVAVGGAIWAWLYERSGTLWGAWLSHLLVDAGLMWVGYRMVWGP